MSDLLDFSPPGQTTFTLAGAKAYFFNAGTTTPRTVYADQALSVAHPSPLVADGSGKFAQAFVSGGPVKVVVTRSDDSTGYTLDPCVKVGAAGAGAASISFEPTIDLPYDNVQDAIEGAAATAASGFTPFGLGVTGSVALLANIDAANIASGQYRFDGTTAGTYPTGVADADTGAISMIRETSGSGWMVLYHDTTDRTWFRRLNSSAWGAWRENLTSNQPLAAGDLFFRGASNVQRLALGSAGQVLRVNAGATAPEWAAATSGQMTFATPQATTSGSNFDFGSIPSTATEIEVVFRGVSLNGTDNILVQLGTSGGIVSSGYDSFSLRSAFGSNANATSTVGATIATTATTDAFTGVYRFVKSAGNTWTGVLSGFDRPSGFVFDGGGEIALSGVLTQVRITRSGSNSFDAGSVTVGYR